jgi:quercetin dioxygenase-like cupin family protein
MTSLKIQKVPLDYVLDPQNKDDAIIERISNSSTDTQGLGIALVKFPAGVRRPWSSHPQDQYVLIVSGKGIIASRDEEIELNQGDLVFVPASLEHQHGASMDKGMVQLSIIGGIKPRKSLISL